MIIIYILKITYAFSLRLTCRNPRVFGFLSTRGPDGHEPDPSSCLLPTQVGGWRVGGKKILAVDP